MFTIVLLDSQGCELSNTEEETLKGAKACARARLAEPEYVAAGAHKVEVRNSKGSVLFDDFIPALARGACRWFLKCTNDATTTRPHPILGNVPCCERCNRLADMEAVAP
jgi:hypothetical protein